jgi:hypothetical protein
MRPVPTIHQLGVKHNTDKTTEHVYDAMYDFWLAPLRCKPVKVLEIGLGCNMGYGPGHSYHMWLDYFPFVELHFLEYDASCVATHQSRLTGATIHVGDQTDINVLKKLLRTSGGNFDVIIDDGAHTWDEQHIATEYLYVQGVKPGGLFVMEDLFTSDLERPASQWYHASDYYKSKTRSTTIEKYVDIQRQLMKEWQVPTDPWVAWTKQMSCGVGMCVFQKWTQFDFDNHHLGNADMLRRARTPPAMPDPASWV